MLVNESRSIRDDCADSPSLAAPMGAACVHHHWAAAAEARCTPRRRHRDAPGWGLQPPVSHREFLPDPLLPAGHSCQKRWLFCNYFSNKRLFLPGSTDYSLVNDRAGYYWFRHAGGHWLCHSFQPSVSGQVKCFVFVCGLKIDQNLSASSSFSSLL